MKKKWVKNEHGFSNNQQKNINKSEFFSVQLENVLLKFPPKKLSIKKIRLERKKIIANVPFDIKFEVLTSKQNLKKKLFIFQNLVYKKV